jgi:hypothetical protein
VSASRSIDVPESEPLLIVCAYPEGMLAGSWFRAYLRLKRTMRRGAYDARVELVPITELPPRLDVLIVPTSLASTANTMSGVQAVSSLRPNMRQPEFERLVESLVRERVVSTGPPLSIVPWPFIVVSERWGSAVA